MSHNLAIHTTTTQHKMQMLETCFFFFHLYAIKQVFDITSHDMVICTPPIGPSLFHTQSQCLICHLSHALTTV